MLLAGTSPAAAEAACIRNCRYRAFSIATLIIADQLHASSLSPESRCALAHELPFASENPQRSKYSQLTELCAFQV